MQPLDSMRVESCNDARCIKSYFRDEFFRGLVRRMRREVRLVMVDERGVTVRLMTMGKMSTSVPNQCGRMALTRGVYLARINSVVWERLWSVQ
jgi:hypothetical protein